MPRTTQTICCLETKGLRYTEQTMETPVQTDFTPPAISAAPISTLALGSLLLMLFLAAIETTILSTAMPKILLSLGSPELYPWAFAAFLIASTIATPFYGKFADAVGIRKCMFVAAALFLGGAALCGSAQTMPQLVAFRAIQGLGASGLMGLTMIAFGVLFTPEERGAKQSLVSLVWGISSLLGPLLGGLIVTYSSWRWIFWFNVPLGLLACAVFYAKFPHQARSERPFQMDWVGSLLLFSGLLLFMLNFSINHPIVWVGYPVSALLLAAFAWQQRSSNSPLIPLRHFQRPTFAISVLLGFGASVTMFTALTYVPLYLQEVRHFSPTQAGFVLTPMMIAWPLMSTAAGLLMNRLRFRKLVVVGATLMALGFLCWALPDPGHPLWLIGLYSGLLGGGMGAIASVTIVAAQVSVPTHEVGAASGSINLFRNIGSTLGVNALGALQVRVMQQSNLPTSLQLVFQILLVISVVCVLVAVAMPALSPAQAARQAHS